MISLDFAKLEHLSCHHEQVQKGSVYFAIRGTKHNGEDYIATAIGNGATAVVLEGEQEQIITRNGVLFYYTKNIRTTLSNAAASVYPQQPQYIMAVTGTSGKTSVAEYCRQISKKLGRISASLGSLGVNSDIPELMKIETLTTPDPITLHQLLQKMAQYQVSHLGMEASSHGLDQNRMEGVRLSAAGFTNLTHEHLDYHQNMEQYFQAKLRLFAELLPNNGTAVLNADSSYYQRLKDICQSRGIRMISYGRQGDIVMRSYDNANLELELFGQLFHTAAQIGAEFQAYNIMCALALVIAVESNGTLDEILATVPYLRTAKGRLELAAIYNGAEVYVDHAHKPDSLEKVLEALRLKCKGKLFLVFGCGGGRDVEKRRIMGTIAAKLADIVIVTDDNPRNEEGVKIRQQILVGCPEAVEIADRTTAVEHAMSQLGQNDILLIAGKGNEEYQIVGEVKLPYSDFLSVENYIKSQDKRET